MSLKVYIYTPLILFQRNFNNKLVFEAIRLF